MYKVMLVDDNYPILTYLAENIPWDDLGMTVIGTFENGLKALEQAKRTVPDILITDIGMPVMNGLELIENVQKLNPELLSLIISCHDEFTYAQKAIQLKVGDYILKEAIRLEQIVERLKVFQTILAGRQQKPVRVPGEGEREMLKTQWLRNTLNYDIWDIDRWAGQALQYGIDVKDRTCVPIVGIFRNGLQVQHLKNLSDTLFSYATANIMTELLAPYRNYLYFPYQTGVFFLFVIQERKESGGGQPIRHRLVELKAALHRIMTLHTSFMVGAGSETPHQLLTHLLRLWKRKDLLFYPDHGTISADDDVVFSREDIYAHYLDVLDKLRFCLFGDDPARIDSAVNEVIRWLSERRFAPGLVKEFMSKLLIDLQIEIRNMQPYRDVRVEASIHEMMANLNCLEEVGYVVHQFLKKAVALMDGIYHQSHRKEILDVQRFIVAHIDQNISLHEVARRLHLNHSYLSRLFKKETGENFVDYTMRMKVKRAKELLDNTGKSVEEIAEMIGYESAYFYKIFKKATGVTPSEYRAMAKRKAGIG